MSEMRVVGVRVELPANQPILLLRETEGDRYLPIWIGSVEATAIALEQQGVKPARPLTHDLLKDVISSLGRRLEQVRITDLQEGTFFAELIFDGGITVSARPSDSVALALRIGVPIHAEETVLAEAGLIDAKTVTSWPSIRTDLKNAGANVVDQEVATDGKFITSRNPDDIPAFSKALIDMLGETVADSELEAA